MSERAVPEAAGQEQGRRSDGRFRRGVSGNPQGRPPGAGNRASMTAEALLAGEAEALTRKAVELASGGNMVAMRLCMERILPPVRERPVCLDLPLVGPADADAAMKAILEALRAGELTASDMGALAKLVEAFVVQARSAEGARQGDEISKLFPDFG